MVQARIIALAVDSLAQPVVVLMPVDDLPGSGKVLPIWIGAQEATSILIATQGAIAPRPLSHDLMKTMLESVDAAVERVEVTRIDEGTYFAEITLRTRSGVLVLDARPSDAIALAVRFDTPIHVNDELLEEAGVDDAMGSAEEEDEEPSVEEFRKFLDEVDPEDFQG
jgi:bifunctional DNase/RNase